MITNLKNVLPFWFFLVFNICCMLVLGWNFGISSGFELIVHWESIWSVLAAIFMILSLVSIFLMLFSSIWGICASKSNSMQFGSWGLQTMLEFLFFVFAVSSIFVFVFASASVGFLTFGLILFLLVNVLGMASYLTLRQKNLVEKHGLIEKFKNSQEQEKPKQKKTKKEQKNQD